MKSIIRNFLINLISLVLVSRIIPSFSIGSSPFDIGKATVVFMLANVILVPLIRILLLPINLLTFGLFAWLANVIALYLLVRFVPSIKLLPFYFPGANINGFILPSMNLTSFQTAIIVSLVIGLIIHFFHWLAH